MIEQFLCHVISLSSIPCIPQLLILPTLLLLNSFLSHLSLMVELVAYRFISLSVLVRPSSPGSEERLSSGWVEVLIGDFTNNCLLLNRVVRVRESIDYTLTLVKTRSVFIDANVRFESTLLIKTLGVDFVMPLLPLHCIEI